MSQQQQVDQIIMRGWNAILIINTALEASRGNHWVSLNQGGLCEGWSFAPPDSKHNPRPAFYRWIVAE